MSTVTAVPIPPVKRSYLIWLVAGIALALVAAVALAFRATTSSPGTRAPTVSSRLLPDFSTR